MRRNLSNLAVTAILTASLFVGACNDSAGDVFGPDTDGFDLAPQGNTRDGGEAQQGDRKQVVEFDEKGIPL